GNWPWICGAGARAGPPWPTWDGWRHNFSLLNLEPIHLIPVPKFGVKFGATFAIGRVQSVAAAGRAQAHPWVRWGGLPGRRSHTSMTQWALGFISTVRIGAGAWRKLANTRESGDTDQASTNSHPTALGTQERKEKEQEVFKNKNSSTRWKRSISVIIITPPLPRATPLHSVALRAISPH